MKKYNSINDLILIAKKSEKGYVFYHEVENGLKIIVDLKTVFKGFRYSHTIMMNEVYESTVCFDILPGIVLDTGFHIPPEETNHKHYKCFNNGRTVFYE